MAKYFGILFLLALSAFEISSEPMKFSGYKVFRANIEQKYQFEAIQNLERDGGEDFNFWSELTETGPVDIMASPAAIESLKKLFLKNKISYSVMIEDVQPLIDAEKPVGVQEKGRMTWDRYHTYQEIQDWLYQLYQDNSDIMTLYYAGDSYDMHEINVVKISKDNGKAKKGFWIDGTIHAREWISPAVTCYILNQLVTNSSAYDDILEDIDFYIMPMINPDGYIFTHTSNRMWRKSRQQHSGNCIGVDINRNFAFQFGGPGSSNDPCSETYRGPNAWSEPESGVVRNTVEFFRQVENVNWVTFITTHSYSQLWMTPWGYTLSLPDDYTELKEVGDRAALALQSHFGTTYRVGSASNILYQSSGSSRDWAKGQGGFRYVYTIELRDTGRYGFILPPDQILDSSVETWSGIQVVARHMLTN